MLEHWEQEIELKIAKIGGVKHMTSEIKVAKNIY